MRTQYNNIVFRSHLESLWARFFDRERLTWLYEPETFREGIYSYTPDFKVSNYIWVEVKGKTIPLNNSLRLCPRPLIVLCGSPSVHFAILVTDRIVQLPYWEAALDRVA